MAITGSGGQLYILGESGYTKMEGVRDICFPAVNSGLLADWEPIFLLSPRGKISRRRADQPSLRDLNMSGELTMTLLPQTIGQRFAMEMMFEELSE